jgi:hypothetical protein
MTGQAPREDSTIARNDKARSRRRDNFVSTRDIMGPYKHDRTAAYQSRSIIR